MKALQFGSSSEGEETIRRTSVKALNFDGSSEGEECIRKTNVKTQHFGDGEEAAIRTREMMAGIGRETPMRRKSTPLCDT